MAPSLNQCWLIIVYVCDIHLKTFSQEVLKIYTYPCYELKKYLIQDYSNIYQWVTINHFAGGYIQKYSAMPL